MLVLFFSSSLAQWSCLVKGEGYRIHFSFFAYHYYFNSLNFKSQVIHGNSVLPPLTVVSFGKLIITHKQRLKCYSGLLEAKERITIFLGGKEKGEKEKEPKVKRKFFLLTDDLDWRTWKLKQQWLAVFSSQPDCLIIITPSLQKSNLPPKWSPVGGQSKWGHHQWARAAYGQQWIAAPKHSHVVVE